MKFQIPGLTALILFYGIYIGKMIMQRSKGIQTDQMAKGGKKGSLFWTELWLKTATYLVVLVEGISVAGNFNPLLLLCSCFAAMMLHLQILQEEKFLAETFGAEYTEYKKRVKRYWGKRKIPEKTQTPDRQP